MNRIFITSTMGFALLATLLMLVAACAGADGNEGPEGPPGPAGAPGQHGVQGPDGGVGAPGAPGQHGAQGPDGGVGPAGARGPAGADGAEGAPGVDGAIVDNGVNFQVLPPVLVWPKREKSAGAWFIGSGLQPGQWFDITLKPGGESVTLLLFGDDRGPSLKQANSDGAFALGFPIDGRSNRWLSSFVLDDFHIITVTLSDQDTGEVLATAPWVLCDGDEDELELCEVASPVIETGRINR